jgi:5-bromo-4-chloroindolyl phosphate hydrolysis protein
MGKAKLYNPSTTLPSSRRGILLYLFLIPLFIAVILALLQTNIQAFLLNSLAFALFFTTAKLSTKGFTQELEYLRSPLTKAPKIPYKTIAALLLGGSTVFTAWVAGGKPFLSALFLGSIATLGYYLFYGFDPKKDKLDNLGDVSAEFVLETIGEAKTKLTNIEKHMDQIEDTLLYEKLNIAVTKAQNILYTIQEDPKDIRVARKFLIVYIDGIAKVTDSYVSMDEDDINSETKVKLYRLMEDLDTRFDKELERLKNNNQFDLDVHIDVLKEQIKH